jgi:hypothetical protein
MRRSLVASGAVLLLVASAPAAHAQTCSNATVGDGCAVASDFFRYMAPQLGTAIAGGSHTLGIGTNLGGFPHFAVALRVNAVQGSAPVINDVLVGAAQQRSFGVEDAPIPMATVDFALGLTKGFNLGVTRVGGIDLIGGVTYLPEIEGDEFSLVPQNNVAVGLGARVGILEQSALIPGVSLSYMKRDLPTVNLGASADDGTSFGINDLSVKTTSWRISAQKNLLLFQLGAGYGGDTYDYSTSATVTVSGVGGGTATMTDAQSVTRTTMYGTLGINLWLFKIVGEVGQVSGGNITTFNDFATPANEARNYGTLGIRINF